MANADTQVKTGPLFNKMLLLFMIAMILANMGGEMYGMLLPLYLKELNASVVQIGLFFTISQIIPLVVQILGGWVSDSLGRLRSIALGSVAGNLTFVGFIFAPTWQPWEAPSLPGLNSSCRRITGRLPRGNWRAWMQSYLHPSTRLKFWNRTFISKKLRYRKSKN